MASRSAGTFLLARDRLHRDIQDIVLCLNNKGYEMSTEIDRLEREFGNKQQQQQQKELYKLKNLKSQTEELGENNLLTIQHKLIQEIEQEIETLTLSSIQEPNYKIGIKWGFIKTDVIHCINRSNIELTTDPTAGELLTPDATDSSEELNTELAILPGHIPDSTAVMSVQEHGRIVSPVSEDTPQVTEGRQQRERPFYDHPQQHWKRGTACYPPLTPFDFRGLNYPPIPESRGLLETPPKVFVEGGYFPGGDRYFPHERGVRYPCRRRYRGPRGHIIHHTP